MGLLCLMIMPVFAIAGLLYYFGTTFRTSSSSISFGLKRYPLSDLSEYRFEVSQYSYQSHDNKTFVRNSWKMSFGGGVPMVKVAVYRNGTFLRTHMFTMSSERAAQKLILKINRGIDSSRKML